MNRFLILGNGGGGTSLMRGLINAHSQIECAFENKGGGTYKASVPNWTGCADKSACKLWGNKMPVEQFSTRKWTDAQIISLVDDFKIIWVTRRFSRYRKDGFATEEKYRNWWNWTRTLYWGCKEKHPDRVLQVSFEDLLLRPVIELRRICCFLGVKYEPEMLEGTNNTGLGKYNQAKLNRNKV